jgi:hypothetical protein
MNDFSHHIDKIVSAAIVVAEWTLLNEMSIGKWSEKDSVSFIVPRNHSQDSLLSSH